MTWRLEKKMGIVKEKNMCEYKLLIRGFTLECKLSICEDKDIYDKDTKKYCKFHCTETKHKTHCMSYECDKERHPNYEGYDEKILSYIHSQLYCVDHCKNKKHKHCKEKGCENTAHLEDGLWCTLHCTYPGYYHDHCKAKGCDGNLDCDLHFSSDISMSHCEEEYCRKKAHEGGFCYSHCEIEGHGHCKMQYCGKKSHIQGGSFCYLHCKIEGHGHCEVNGCSKKSERKDLPRCVFHCHKYGHGHCHDECDNPDDCCASTYCKKHCQRMGLGHDHCSTYECSEEKCEESARPCDRKFCKKHCEAFKCSHCEIAGCDKKLEAEQSEGLKLCYEHLHESEDDDEENHDISVEKIVKITEFLLSLND